VGKPEKSNRRTTTNLGGRPRVRSGDEVQVTVEFPLEDYARLAGYVEYRKLEAIRNKESVADQSKRKVLMRLWQEYWKSLPSKLRRAVEAEERFGWEMKRGK
jgi:hypothetical protein